MAPSRCALAAAESCDSISTLQKMRRVTGGSTSAELLHRHLLPLLWRWTSFLVTRDHAEVCPLSRGMMLSSDATPIRPITGRRSLSPLSSARIANSLPYGRPARTAWAAIRVYRVPRCSHGWFRFRLSTGGMVSVLPESLTSRPATFPFG
jgi:hypothetical protein